MIRFFITLFFALLIGFGAKGQYVYSYTGVTTPAWHNDKREIEININVTLDSIFNSGGTHYGIYFSYNITFRHHGVDITSQMPTIKEGSPYNFFDNLRLNIGCGGTMTDVGLIPLINNMGYSGYGLAYNNQYLEGITNPTIGNLGCNKVVFHIGYPGLNESQVVENTGLPIELITFDAIKKDRQVELSWKTATETNNDFFTIARSVDGKYWEDLQYIEGAGNSVQVQEYSYTDDAPYAGISYYRLTQTDFDGTQKTFPIVSVEQKDLEVLQAYPNPVVHTVTLMGVKENQAIRIFNAVGIEVTENTQVSISPSKKTLINMNDLPKGVYYIVNGAKQIKVLKQ
nr:T9SS type A sorting domain-containing protein [uncultured Brumimicrobium sp.]